MRFELDEHHRNVTNDELIADVQRVAAGLGKRSVTMFEQNDHGRFHSSTIWRRFGTWFAVLEKAGLEQTRTPPNIPDVDLFRNLEEVWTHLGRQPKYQDLKDAASAYGNSTYAKRFGSWRKALEAFVTYINTEEDSSLPAPADISLYGNRPRPQGPRDINWRLRFIVMRRDNFKCKACGRSPATDPSVTLDVDHIQAWSKGGLTVIENLQTLCTKCNIGKSDLEFISPEVQNAEV
ncbi:MAG: homing endonuclease associated repeat-containing protein [Acidobacteriaceae bacterium]